MKKKIIFVDDSSVHLMLAEGMTKGLRSDLDVICFKSGVEALKNIPKIKDEMSLALIDYNMTPMNGLELLEELMKDIPTHKLYICSANIQKAIEEKVLKLGATFVMKPLTKVKLKEILDKIAA